MRRANVFDRVSFLATRNAAWGIGLYEGRQINELQNAIILLIFKI